MPWKVDEIHFYCILFQLKSLLFLFYLTKYIYIYTHTYIHTHTCMYINIYIW